MKLASAVFYVAAAYDGILGILFLVFPISLLESFHVAAPYHPGYIQFPAALLIVFSIMFTAIARNPSANRNLIPYGMLLKVSYCCIVFWYWVFGSISYIWKPFAIFDLVFLLLFIWVYRGTARTQQG